jgi:ribosomal protein S1
MFGKIKSLFKKKPEVIIGKPSDFLLPIQETKEEKKQRQINEYMQFLVETAKKNYGYDDAHATKWAWQQVDKKMQKQRMKGTPVSCAVCGKSGINRETGQFVRTAEGKYRHQNCRGNHG